MGKKNINVVYKCLGASKSVTGSCGLITIKVNNKETNIIIDYGMVQNNTKSTGELFKINGADKPVKWENIDTIILSHSHADHVSLLPIAIINGYKGDIITTAPSMRLTRLILTDSAYLQNKECVRYNKTAKGKKNPIYPLYSQRHVESTLERFKGYDYNIPIKIDEYITITLKSTGHLLGASSIYIEVKDRMESETILFTGDTSGLKKLVFTKQPDFTDLKIDHIISEGTYGNRLQSKNNVKEKLKEHIENTCILNKGQLMIPVFSVGRSTSVVSYLYDLFKENPEFEKVPVYLASPMANKSHLIYGDSDSFNFYDEENEKYKGMFLWEHLQKIEDYTVLEKEVLNSEPKIILVSSGMISGGYSVAVATSVLPSEKNTILFCGYQGLGCNGRYILESELGKKIKIDNKEVKRNCNLDFMSMSSHGDYRDIINMFKTMRHKKIKTIFLQHGDLEALTEFKEHLNKEFNAEVVIANYNMIYKL